MSAGKFDAFHAFVQTVLIFLTVVIAWLTYNNSESIQKLAKLDSTLVTQNGLMRSQLDSFSKQIVLMDSQLQSFKSMAY